MRHGATIRNAVYFNSRSLGDRDSELPHLLVSIMDNCRQTSRPEFKPLRIWIFSKIMTVVAKNDQLLASHMLVRLDVSMSAAQNLTEIFVTLCRHETFPDFSGVPDF